MQIRAALVRERGAAFSVESVDLDEPRDDEVLVRIVATGIAGQYNHAWVGGATHEAFGYVSVVVAALGCIGVPLALVRFDKMREARHA